MYASAIKQGKVLDKKGRGTRAVFLLLGLVAILGWAYILFVSDLFTVDAVQTQWLKTLDEIDVGREVYAVLDSRQEWRPWPKRHSWFINESSLAEELKKRLFAANVKVENPHTHVLRLIVEERSNKLILHSHQQFFWVDLQGAVTGELSADERNRAQSVTTGKTRMNLDDPPIIHFNQADDLLAPGFSMAPGETIKQWIKTSSELAKGGLTYRELLMSSATSTLSRVISDEGYPVLIDFGDNLEPQLKAYIAFKNAKPKDMKITEYIDVRVPGRIYVK